MAARGTTTADRRSSEDIVAEIQKLGREIDERRERRRALQKPLLAALIREGRATPRLTDEQEQELRDRAAEMAATAAEG